MVSKLLHMNRMWEIHGLPPFCSNAAIYRPGKNPNKLLFYSRTPFSLKFEIHRNSTREKYPNTELFLVCIQSEYRKYGPGITLYLDFFHAVSPVKNANSTICKLGYQLKKLPEVYTLD